MTAVVYRLHIKSKLLARKIKLYIFDIDLGGNEIETTKLFINGKSQKAGLLNAYLMKVKGVGIAKIAIIAWNRYFEYK
jgi:hypothetical protein